MYQKLVDQIVAWLTRIATGIEVSQEVLRAQLATTQGSSVLRGDRPIAVGENGLRLAWGGPGRLTGWTLGNPGKEVALVYMRDGRDHSADLIALVVIPPGSSRDLAAGRPGISFTEALYVEIFGRATGAVWIGREQ